MYAKYLKQFNSDVQFTQRTSLLDINNEVSKSQDEPRLFSFAQPAQSQQPLANQIAQKFKEYEDPRYTKYFREDSEYSDFQVPKFTNKSKKAKVSDEIDYFSEFNTKF